MKLKELMETIRSETRPIEGHSDPKAIVDCWLEVFRLLFTDDEIQIIYDNAVSFLENMYRGNYEDIDLAYEPVERFDADEKEIKHWQSIIIKIGGP